jgi:hypothetical protein
MDKPKANSLIKRIELGSGAWFRCMNFFAF